MIMNQTKQVSQYKKMTEEPIPRLVLTLAVPSIISMLINNIYNLCWNRWSGRC